MCLAGSPASWESHEATAADASAQVPRGIQNPSGANLVTLCAVGPATQEGGHVMDKAAMASAALVKSRELVKEQPLGGAYKMMSQAP